MPAAKKTEEAAPKTEEVAQKPAPAQPKASTMVKVHNPQRFHYVQPGSGIRIGGKETRELLDDGWLKLQLDAGVLEKA